MKFFTGLVISAGLVSANLTAGAPGGGTPGGANLQAGGPPPGSNNLEGGAGGPPPPSGGNEDNDLFGSLDGLDGLDGLDELDGEDSLDSGLDLSELDLELESSGLDLGDLQISEIDGLNLGNIDFSNNDEMIEAISQLLNGLCLGNVFSQSSLGGMQSDSLQDLLIEIAEMWELLELGFTNLGDVQNMFLGSVQPGASSELIAGILKRAIEAHKKVSLKFGHRWTTSPHFYLWPFIFLCRIKANSVPARL
jgi:hypothetical protein